MGITVLLRDILFKPTLPYQSIQLACLVLSVTMLLMLTYFYARKEWETYGLVACFVKEKEEKQKNKQRYDES